MQHVASTVVDREAMTLSRDASAELGIKRFAWRRTNERADRVLDRRVRLAGAFLDIDRLIGRTDERTSSRRALRGGAAGKQQGQRAGRRSLGDDQPRLVSQGAGSIAR